MTDDHVAAVISNTLEATPPDATRWSTWNMARTVGFSQSASRRIWRAFGRHPHRTESHTLSTDPLFVDKVCDVVGLYLGPPERAVVQCVDGKTQIQALNRRQPILPLLPGTPERRSLDYQRQGTTSLFAALNLQSGKIVGSLHRHHRTHEFKQFLGRLVIPSTCAALLWSRACQGIHDLRSCGSWFPKQKGTRVPPQARSPCSPT